MKRILLALLPLAMTTGLMSKEVNSWTKALHNELKEATRLQIRSGGTCHRQAETEKTLLDLQDPEKVAIVTQGIQIAQSESGFHCMCCGNPTLEFYRGDTLIASLGFHHARSLRWPDGKWEGDGLLTEESSIFLIKWMADNGLSGPKDEREEDAELRIRKFLQPLRKRLRLTRQAGAREGSFGRLTLMVECFSIPLKNAY